jgi:hypothetical protein
VSVLSDATANLRVPQTLDVIWTAQNYHDLHDAFMGPADGAALNKRFFDAESNVLRNALDDHKSSCSTAACGAEPIRLCTSSANPSEGFKGLARNLLKLTCLCSISTIDRASDRFAAVRGGKVTPLSTGSGKLLPLDSDSFFKRIAYVITCHSLDRQLHSSGGEHSPTWSWS